MTGLMRREDLKHLEPLVRAVHEAEEGQRDQGAGEAELARAPRFQEYDQSQGEEGEPIEEVDVDDVAGEERRYRVHDNAFCLRISPQKHQDTKDTKD